MDNKTLENLRLDLIEELKAVNQYQKHIDETDNQEVKKALSHIRDEEKEHVAELLKVIRKLDEIQEQMLQKPGH